MKPCCEIFLPKVTFCTGQLGYDLGKCHCSSNRHVLKTSIPSNKAPNGHPTDAVLKKDHYDLIDRCFKRSRINYKPEPSSKMVVWSSAFIQLSHQQAYIYPYILLSYTMFYLHNIKHIHMLKTPNLSKWHQVDFRIH